jgi:hypothetical protein
MRAPVLPALAASLMLGCSERWEGYVYPDKSNLSKHRFVGQFESLEECRRTALSELSRLSAINRGDYECGLNCEAHASGLRVCKKTER